MHENGRVHDMCAAVLCIKMRIILFMHKLCVLWVHLYLHNVRGACFFRTFAGDMEKQDKKARLQAIKVIVGNCPIGNQEELAVELNKAGFSTTQTMLSRDLRQLRISKVRTRSGKSVYALPGVVYFDPVKTREELNATKWSLQFSGNIAVLHTPPGHAPLAASEIDEIKSPYVLGTVAGDDTVMIVISETADCEMLRLQIAEVVPQLKKRR